MQSTELVHEAYLRLVNQKQARWQDRVHFFAVSGQIMRHILVDHARAGARARCDSNHTNQADGGDSWDRCGVISYVTGGSRVEFTKIE